MYGTQLLGPRNMGYLRLFELELNRPVAGPNLPGTKFFRDLIDRNLVVSGRLSVHKQILLCEKVRQHAAILFRSYCFLPRVGHFAKNILRYVICERPLSILTYFTLYIQCIPKPISTLIHMRQTIFIIIPINYNITIEIQYYFT